jgi:uncharacterized protein (DUF2249 family)
VAEGGRESSDPAWLTDVRVVAEVDARTFQSTGEDPFFVIQDTARTVLPGEAFRLTSAFPPVPLYGVLARKGFAYHEEEIGPAEWVITFYRERAVSEDVDADDAHPHGTTRT